MKRYGNLFEQIVTFSNLRMAAQKAFRGKKDRNSVSSFYFNLENEILELQRELASLAYRPQPYFVFEIREPKVRLICSSDFRDRVVHHAICNILEPIFEKRLIDDTYACRVGKGTHAAIRRCQYFTRKQAYFLKCDIQKYFESIDHECLKVLLRRMIKDPVLLKLLDTVIDHQVPGSLSGKGVPIGNLTSQHFANLYLGELDHFLKERKQVKGLVRYMDDFICFSESKEQLQEWLSEIREFLEVRLKLRLKEKVVTIAPVTEGVPFLGFRIFKNLIRIQRPNLVRTRQKIERGNQAYLRGQLEEEKWIQSTQSLLAHLSCADSMMLRRKELEDTLILA